MGYFGSFDWRFIITIILAVGLLVLRLTDRRYKKDRSARLQAVPTEKFAIVFRVRSEAGQIKPGDDLYYVYEFFTTRLEPNRRVTIHIGKVMRVEHAIVEVQAEGWMHYNKLLPLGANTPNMGASLGQVYIFDGFELGMPCDVTTDPQGGKWVVKGKSYRAKVLEIRQADQPSQIQPEAVH